MQELSLRLARTHNQCVDYALLEKLKSLQPFEQTLYSIAMAYLTWFVIIGVLSDLMAMIGLVSVILKGNFTDYFYFGLPAILLEILNYPKLDSVLETAIFLNQNAIS
jgi:hypothetical protein